MRFLFITLGSTGDVLPLLNLSRELHRRGHHCTLSTQDAFQSLASGYPVQWAPLFHSPPLNDLPAMMLEIYKRKRGSEVVDYFYHLLFQELAARREELLSRIDEADLVVASYLFPFFALIARARGVPARTVSFSHRFFPSRNHHPLFETRRRLPLNRASWKFFFWYINRKMRAHLRRAGMLDLLPPSYELRDEYVAHTHLVVPTCFRDNLLQPDEPCNFVGSLVQTGAGESLPPDLEDFLSGEPVPLLNFGSVTFPGADDLMRDFLRHWPSSRKILIQSGWAGLTHKDPPENVRIIGHTPHRDLLPRISTLIHHGGAGTTAAALHAGVPQIIVPHIADQWFLAGEIERLGVGRRLPRRIWPRRLPALLQAVENNSALIRAAKQLAGVLESENGNRRLSDQLESLLDPAPQPPS